MIYKFKRSIQNLEPEVVGEYLEQLEQQYGSITPEMLVKKAKAKRNPLHNYFDWDDKSAAEQYRIVQARYILRIIIREETPNGPENMRAFVNVVTSGQQSVYMPTAKAMANATTRIQLLEKAKDDLKAWRIKYHRLQELAKIIKIIDETLDGD